MTNGKDGSGPRWQRRKSDTEAHVAAGHEGSGSGKALGSQPWRRYLRIMECDIYTGIVWSVKDVSARNA